MIFDKMQSASAIKVNLLSQALILMVVASLLGTATGFLLITTLTGFHYGEFSFCTFLRLHVVGGAERVSQIYGWLFSSNIPTSLSPILAGLVFDTLHSFNLALYGLSVLLFVGAVMVHKNSSSLNSAAKA